MRVFTVRADGSDLRQVTGGEVVDQIDPQWSADGQTLYFFEDHPAGWIVGADGSVTYAPGKHPQGRLPSMRAIPAAGGSDREVLRDWITEREMYTHVHPTGRAVAYTRALNGSPTATLVRDLTTGAEETLPRMLVQPKWSPDGERLAGVTEGRAVNCRSDGTGCVELGLASSVSWSADGRTILLRREAAPLDEPRLVAMEIAAVPAGGGPERIVARLAPLSRFCSGISVAPDGRIAWVAYDRGRQELWSARLGAP
jgi:Tol biopolymer transport system component